jgi:hypothetical protein
MQEPQYKTKAFTLEEYELIKVLEPKAIDLEKPIKSAMPKGHA